MPPFIRQLWKTLSQILTPRVQSKIETHTDLGNSLHDTLIRMFQPAMYGTLAQIQESPDTPAHVYVTFRTHDSDVELAPYLRLQYPKELSIVLQHQFFDLVVGNENFSVILFFEEKEERVTVPWSAITQFRDATSSWGLRRPDPSPDRPSSPQPDVKDEPQRPANANVVYVDFSAGKPDPKPKPK
jgi:hypothetical protein